MATTDEIIAFLNRGSEFNLECANAVANALALFDKESHMLHKHTIQNILWKLRKEWIGDSQPLVMNQTQLSIRLFITDLSNDIDKQPDDPLPTPTPVELKFPDFIPESIDDMERRHIIGMLKYKNWHKSESARMLGIERSTLDRKLKAYGIERPA